MLNECPGVGYTAPRNVNEKGVVAHAGQKCVIHEMMSACVEGNGNNDDVGVRQQFADRVHRVDVSGGVVALGAGNPNDLHLEGLESVNDGGAHAAYSNNNHGAIGEATRAELLPAPFILLTDNPGNTTLGRENQCERLLSSGCFVHGCGISKHHARGKILHDAVVPDVRALNQFEIQPFEMLENRHIQDIGHYRRIQIVARWWTVHCPKNGLDVKT